jgi:hypothetical protein
VLQWGLHSFSQTLHRRLNTHGLLCGAGGGGFGGFDDIDDDELLAMQAEAAMVSCTDSTCTHAHLTSQGTGN